MSVELHEKAHQFAEEGDWDNAIKTAQKVPDHYETFDSLAANYVIPPSHIEKFLQSTPRSQRSNVLFEISGQLHPDLKHEHLDLISKLAGPDSYVKENVESHKNWNPSKDPDFLRKLAASNFWKSYEKMVHPIHFAAIKSMYSGKPETIKFHRNDTEAYSHGEHYISHSGALIENQKFRPTLGSFRIHDEVIPHLKDHAERVQKAILADDNIPKRMINGVPHIQLFRGVGGRYAQKIHDAIEKGATSFKLKKAPFSSWTIDPDVARNFAVGRAYSSSDENYPHMAIMSSWIPIDKVLHSGFHTVHTGQKHAHPIEREIVIGHPEGYMIIHSQNVKISKVNPKLKPQT